MNKHHDKKNRSRLGAGRLWDDTGRPWECVAEHLSSEEAEALVLDESCRMCVQHDFGQPLLWIEGLARVEMWMGTIKAHFAPGTRRWGKHRRGKVPYEASLWGSEGDRLVFFVSD